MSTLKLQVKTLLTEFANKPHLVSDVLARAETASHGSPTNLSSMLAQYVPLLLSGFLLTACARTTISGDGHSIQGESAATVKAPDSRLAESKLTAEEVISRTLLLIGSLKATSDLSLARTQDAMGRTIEYPVASKHYSSADILTQGWFYQLHWIEEPTERQSRFMLWFINPDGDFLNPYIHPGRSELSDVATTPICAMDFHRYATSLDAMGFKVAQGSYEDSPRYWVFVNQITKIAITITTAREARQPPAKLHHRCITSIAID